MFSFLNNILDRCFFTLTFIFGVQLPEFIQQYKQRLSGHLDEAQRQVEQFQAIADLHYQGQLTALIEKYIQNSDESIASTGQLLHQLVYRVDYLQTQVAFMYEKSYLQQVKHLLLEGDSAIIFNTAQQFVIAMPLTIEAITTGAVIAFGALFLKELSLYFSKKLAHKLWPSSQAKAIEK